MISTGFLVSVITICPIFGESIFAGNSPTTLNVYGASTGVSIPGNLTGIINLYGFSFKKPSSGVYTILQLYIAFVLLSSNTGFEGQFKLRLVTSLSDTVITFGDFISGNLVGLFSSFEISNGVL